MNIVLRGLFLTSENPEATARFYEDVARLPLERIHSETGYTYWRTDDQKIQFAIHHAEKFSDYTYPAHAESNLTHLYFRIESQAEFLAHIEKLEIVPCAADEVVITVIDPDGRKVMFGTA